MKRKSRNHRWHAWEEDRFEDFEDDVLEADEVDEVDDDSVGGYEDEWDDDDWVDDDWVDDEPEEGYDPYDGLDDEIFKGRNGRHRHRGSRSHEPAE